MNWLRLPLSPEDCARLDGVRWKAVSREMAQAVAEGWNAGVTTAEMAKVARVSPGTYRVLLGKLTQTGIRLRRAGEPALTGEAAADPAPPVLVGRANQTIAHREGLTLADPNRADRLLRRFSWQESV